MGNRWRKVKLLLGLKICAITPPDDGPVDDDHNTCAAANGSSCDQDALSQQGPAPDPVVGISYSSSALGQQQLDSSSAPGQQQFPPSFSAPIVSKRPASSTLSLGRHSLRLSRSTCSICLETMKPGRGHALFTAECSHIFHFSCIASNVRHGNLVCPVCRANWREVPWQAPMDGYKSDKEMRGSHTRGFFSLGRNLVVQHGGREVGSHFSEEVHRPDSVLHNIGQNISQGNRHQSYPAEPNTYDDDEPFNHSANDGGVNVERRDGSSSRDYGPEELSAQTLGEGEGLVLKLVPELPAVPAYESHDSFTLLLHLKAPSANARTATERTDGNLLGPSARAAPLDLVTVLDISGSMAGTKLGLLKQAMHFVVSNLGPADRLSVVVFSSIARRIFPLRRMSEEGRQEVIQAIETLIATGGTNISSGLNKGAKVLADRQQRNPVSAIILLSDGQDTFSLNSQRQHPFLATQGSMGSRWMVPASIRHSGHHGQVQIPVHTFGFGADHDAATMHTIAEASGGTFSFIQTERIIQDAFAQCIGGLLSVVVQDLQATVSCSAPGVLINNVCAGSYNSSILDNGRHGIIKFGDLYAEEERDALVVIRLPSLVNSQPVASLSLLQAGCIYTDPATKETKQQFADDLWLERPENLEKEHQARSLDVDRQVNRLHVAEAITEARSLADQGDIAAAQSKLQHAKTALGNSPSALAGDQLCSVLDAELREIQFRMASRQTYERSGRAYLLSAQSSHLRQRATTRHDTLDSHSHDYQTPSMVDMILQSQILSSSELCAPGAFPNAATRANRQNIRSGGRQPS